MPAAGQRALGVARVELGGEGDVADDLLGDPEVGQDRAAHVLERRAAACSSETTPLGSASVRRLSMRIARCGAWAALAKVLSTSPERCDLGAHEVEGLAVEAGLVGDVVHRGGDVVDRHDVRVAELGADEREPLGQRVARLLDRLEEVVGPVDLVHLAGLRVADDDGGPVDPPRHARLLARDLLGLELRAVVGRGQLLALVEHVLAEQALVAAGDGDRRGVVQDAGLERVGQRDRVARAGRR